MHVLILNQTFHPDVAATAQLMWDLALHLDSRGHRVSAVTSRNVYGSTEQLGQSYEHHGNIHIHRVRQTSFGKKHLPGRMADFLSFYASAFHTLQNVGRPDVILALTSPPMIASLGMIQRQFATSPTGRRIKLVYHVMDLYPDAAVAMNVLKPRSFPQRIMSRLTRRTLESSDAIIALGRDMKQRLINEYRLHRHPDRIHVVQPWADGDALRPLPKEENPLAKELGLQHTFNIVYSGNLGMAHDLDTLVQSMEQMRSDNVRFLFIGGGSRFDQLKDHALKSNWPHVIFLPYQDRERLIHSLNLADVHLVSQLPAFTGIVVPSKLFGIMAVGKPVVMVGPPDCECSLVVQETGCGYVIPNGMPTSMTQHLRTLQQDSSLRAAMGHRARAAFEQNYDRPIACQRIEQILTDAVARPR